MGETIGINPDAQEQQRKGPKIVFIAGGRGRYDTIRSIKGSLDKEFGSQNVTIYNSVLFGDRSAPDRFQKMAQDLKQKIAGGPTTILAHSFGAAETMEAFSEIEKEDPDFFKRPDVLANLQLTLISPAGFIENWRQGLKYGAKYAKLGIQEAGMLFGRTLPGKTSILHGIVSASTVPPENMSREQLVQGVRKISGRLSQSDGETREVDAVPDRDYRQFLTEKQTAALDEADTVFAEATSGETTTRLQKLRARKALKKRGRVLKKVIVDTFENRYSDAMQDPQNTEEVYGKNRVASKNANRLAWDTFIKSRVLGKMTEWQRAGMKINIAVPEQDTMMSVDDARDFLQGNEDRLVVTPLSTHSAPWSPQPKILSELVRAFDKQEQQAA